MATIGQARALLTDRTISGTRSYQPPRCDAARAESRCAGACRARARARPAQHDGAQYSGAAVRDSRMDRQAVESWDGRQRWWVVVWTATLYDVDYKSYFLMSFGRDAVRIYRMGQFTGPIDRTLGYAKFPEPTESRFTRRRRAVRIPRSRRPTIRWSDVKELRSGNGCVVVQALGAGDDRVGSRKQETLREIKVNCTAKPAR